ncbi:DUF4350 domain-containing protein [Marininema halotolerans]|uniref:DUF4350 domain-containing protein n=1 Tax=Marininema halotolerans TaxID=1155944 RepID=A0A1I6R863_9BACL|nr:DUF4350 domain-containing protein [Marininema halotolerans]SFS60901.1 hypothetical protein SAMN05444972_104247 [Marininema halotolerans]
MRSRRFGVFVISLLVIVLLVLLLLAVTLDTDSKTPYNSHGTSSQGLKALYLLFDERQLPVDRWDKGWGSFPKGKDQLLILTEPTGFIPKGDQHRLEMWIKEGNTLALFASPNNELAAEWGFSVSPSGNGEQQGKIPMQHRSSLWEKNIKTLYYPEGNRLVNEQGKVWKDQGNMGRLAERNWGKGKVIYVPEPDFMTNKMIRQGDNLAFALHLATEGKKGIWFGDRLRELSDEETSEGKSASLLNWIDPNGWLILMLLTIAVLLWLYGKGRRFGRPLPDRDLEPPFADEYVKAMGSLYQRANLKSESLHIQWQGLLRIASKRWGLGIGVTEETLINHSKRYLAPEVADQMEALSQTIHRLPEHLSGKQFMQLSQEIYQIREEILAWHTHQSTLN